MLSRVRPRRHPRRHHRAPGAAGPGSPRLDEIRAPPAAVARSLTPPTAPSSRPGRGRLVHPSWTTCDGALSSHRDAMTQVYVQRALPRWLIVILGVAGTVVALAGIRSAAGLIGPVFLALMLVVTVH